VPVHVGVGVSVSRGGGPTSGAHAAAAILISESGDTVKRRERRHAFRQAGADGETRYTLEPAAARHPSQGADRRSVTIRPPIPTRAQGVKPHLR
jgi:hypothetical protein